MGKEQADWFENWFDSDYYPVLYAHRDLGEAGDFIKLLFQRLSIQPTAKVIDVACGRGRHAIQLNALGYQVQGIDLSAESIAAAKEHANENLLFDVHDMREVFRNNHFDVSLNLFTSFGYFLHEGDNVKALEAMCNNLKKGGLLILDYLNVNKAEQALPVSDRIVRDSIHFNIEKKVEGKFIVKHIRFQDAGKSFHFQEYVKLIRKSDFQNYFHQFGLEILHTFGDYQLNAFDAQQSDRLILIGRKN